MEHCSHVRYVWNLAVEQHSWWTPRRGPAPGYVAQARRLTEARAEFGWLRAGSQTVQQQALRDFAQGHRANADVNVASNIKDIAVGRTVAARGGTPLGGPVNREPQPALLSV